MKREIQAGKTDYSALVFIPDPASTDGSGKTGLVAANLTVSGTRMETDNDATVIDYTSTLNDLAALTTAHTDWGLKEISSTLAPGLYRLDIADAIFAAGAWTAVVYVMITTSAAAASPMEFVLVTHDPDDLGTKQSGDSFARIGATGSGLTSLATQASVNTIDDFLDTEIAAILSDTNAILLDTGTDGVVVAAASKTGYVLSATGSAALTEGYAADGAAFTLNQGLYMIWSLLAERNASGTTLTTLKLDGATTAMEFTLDAAAPSTQTRSA